ncbi:hypothetical protein [Chitinophaga sp. LS1]|uniref:hypothetical protein n=1 Tax=Chitinophaga sp. LS1 TaxID=3051176 RepID=UPI002AAB1BF6|nr:hypothetical protein [Chitinophaga sp. LS1]WPV68151.1 hypothetical protein QQL36_05375 [Chitinophaga sp. LS1]
MYKFILLFSLLFFWALQYSSAQVDLPRGRAEVNFPLYSYGNSDRLNTTINLTYTGGNGIPVNELASNTGLGWQLQAGGVITRSTRGEPDDQVGGTLDGYVISTGRLYSSWSNTAMNIRATWIPITKERVLFYRGDPSICDDREADVFNFSFNGRNGSFLVGTNGSIKILDNSNLKIEIIREDLSASKILTRFSKFVITDEQGIRYTFSEKVLDKIILYQGYDQKRFVLDPAPANLETYTVKQRNLIMDYYSVNNWYLSEIADPLTNRKISFNYEDYNLAYTAEVQGVFSQSPSPNGSSLTQIVAQRITPLYSGIMKRLLNITLPDNNKVVFSYSSTERIDLPGDKALLQIDILKDNFVVMGYKFDYQYFALTNLRDVTYGFTATEAANARLCLKSFRKFGINQTADNPYQFTYNLGTSTLGVPGRLTPAMDHYGYYNGLTASTFDTDIGIYTNIQHLCLANYRTVIGTINIMGAGTLTGIKYPNGGVLTYVYEVNKAWNGTKEVNGPGIRVKQTILSDGNNINSDILRDYKYVQEDGTTTSCWGYEEPVYEEDVTNTLNIPTKGSYFLAGMGYKTAISVGQQLVGAYFAGTFSKNVNSMANDPKKYNASIGNQLGPILNNTIESVALYIIFDLITSDVKTTTTTYQNYLSAHPKSQNLLPNLYSRVEVYEGSTSDNMGKSVYEFTSDKDFTINYPSVAITYAQKQRCLPWVYGALKRKTVFNKNGELVSESYNRYNAKVNESQDPLFASNVYKPKSYLVTTQDAFNASGLGFYTETYYPITGNLQIAYTTEKVYTGPDFMLSREDYSYDTYNNIIKVTKTNNLNEKEELRTYYPYNYTGTGITKTLTDNNIISAPVAQETWLLKDGTEAQLVSGEIGEFSKISNGDIRIGKTYQFRSNSPVAQSVIGAFDPANLVRNTTYFKEAQSFAFNAAGRVSTQTASGKMTSFIYDDNNEKVIAGAMNASINDIAYSSFEPGQMGNWVITTSGSSFSPTNVGTAPTGSYAVNMASLTNISKSGLDANKHYYLSYWSQNASISINSATVVSETAIIIRNGWTLKILELSNTSGFTISGTGQLDELRLYPVEAVINSTTYTPQAEVSSTMSAQNMALYYEYDNLGRLTNTYDSDRNLTSHSEYQYGQQ